jgi:type II restriction enzyme
MSTLDEAKASLDKIIKKARVDFYKPIQVAEVLYRSRVYGDVDITNRDSFKNDSLRWRNVVTERLLGKYSTSTAQFQHNVWEENAVPLRLLAFLDEENKRTNGGVERYVYIRFKQRLAVVKKMLELVRGASIETFQLRELLSLFKREAGIKRSIDKAYEIVTYSLLETITRGLKVTITVKISPDNLDMLEEFSDLTEALFGIDSTKTEWTEDAHIYRAGVTNAADRGLDMWCNFGPAIQVKHLTLNEELATMIINQVESDHIVIVCQDADERVLSVVFEQIGWGSRVRGIIKESQLIEWFEKCLRGKFKNRLAAPLMDRLVTSFAVEFPQVDGLEGFIDERKYPLVDPPNSWSTAIEEKNKAGRKPRKKSTAKKPRKKSTVSSVKSDKA